MDEKYSSKLIRFSNFQTYFYMKTLVDNDYIYAK